MKTKPQKTIDRQRSNSCKSPFQPSFALSERRRPPVVKMVPRGPALLTIPTPEGYDLIRQEEILYCQSDGNYTTLYLVDRRMVCCRKLKQVEPNLSRGFFVRVHQSYLVNLQYVAKFYRKNGGQLELTDGTIIPI